MRGKGEGRSQGLGDEVGEGRRLLPPSPTPAVWRSTSPVPLPLLPPLLLLPAWAPSALCPPLRCCCPPGAVPLSCCPPSPA